MMINPLRRALGFAVSALILGTPVAWGASSVPKEPVLALPPFLVDSAQGPPWRITRSPEFEILSRCADGTTSKLAGSFHRLHQLLHVVLPAQLQVRLDVPRMLILYDQDLLPVSTQALFAGSEPANLKPWADKPKSPDFLRNPRMCDLDEMTVFASVPHASFEGGLGVGDASQSGWTDLTPAYVGYLLGNRTPSLPPWFISGFMNLYRQMKISDDRIEIGAAFWRSESETRALRANMYDPQVLLPLPELFAGPGRVGAGKLDLWFAQAELFVRWGLDDAKGEHRAAFWKFLDRACTEPVTDALFKEYFGLDLGQGRQRLRDYLAVAVRRSILWPANESLTLAPLEISNATPGEIARIKGEWERLAASYVKTNIPELETYYATQARRTLHRAYDQGDRDPLLLASLGLLESEEGNDSAAREFLESAVAAGVVRPRAYLELARMRLKNARSQSDRDGHKISGEQAAEVLAPLGVARRQAPPLLETYELIADAWENTGARLSGADFLALDEGIKFFPRNTKLIHRVALLYLANGFKAETRALADQGARAAQDDEERRRFAELRAQALE